MLIAYVYVLKIVNKIYVLIILQIHKVDFNLFIFFKYLQVYATHKLIDMYILFYLLNLLLFKNWDILSNSNKRLVLLNIMLTWYFLYKKLSTKITFCYLFKKKQVKSYSEIE